MFHPTWLVLTLVTLISGVLIILAPQAVVGINRALNRAMISMDEIVIRHRHVIGAMLLVVAYLCFRLALLLGH